MSVFALNGVKPHGVHTRMGVHTYESYLSSSIPAYFAVWISNNVITAQRDIPPRGLKMPFTILGQLGHHS